VALLMAAIVPLLVTSVTGALVSRVAAQTSPSTWLAGAGATTVTPPRYNAADDARDFPLCDTTVYSGKRLFDFE
jgi:hypothetical protein